MFLICFLVSQGMFGNLSKDLNEIRRQQMQMEDRANKENEISGKRIFEEYYLKKEMFIQDKNTHFHHLSW